MPITVLQQGQVIWFNYHDEFGIQLAQIPEVEGALISIDPQQGGHSCSCRWLLLWPQ